MTRKTTRKFCISALRKKFGFNSNLTKIHYDQERKNRVGFEFHNQVNGSAPEESEYFEMYFNSCDLNFFEEFGDSCINGFNGTALSDKAVIRKSKEVYQNIVHWFREKERFETFLQQSEDHMEKVVQKIKDLDFVKENQFHSNRLIAYGQLPLDSKGFGHMYKARTLLPVGSAHHY